MESRAISVGRVRGTRARGKGKRKGRAAGRYPCNHEGTGWVSGLKEGLRI